MVVMMVVIGRFVARTCGGGKILDLDFGFRISDFGFRIWDLGFGIWGFGIWGFGFGAKRFPPK